MNSREAAYDEEEQLRRAIEASKELATVPDEGTSRRTKRHRSDSEEYVGLSAGVLHVIILDLADMCFLQESCWR